MADFIGTIKMFGGKYAPDGWAFCNGQNLQITQFEPLFSIIGNKYGGDGITNFSLPDLCGQLPVGFGNMARFENYIGKKGGNEKIIILKEMLHADIPSLDVNGTIKIRVADDVANNAGAVNRILGKQTGLAPSAPNNPVIYRENPNFSENQYLHEKTVDFQLKTEEYHNPKKANIEIDYMPPYVAVNFIIALTGDYPERPTIIPKAPRF